MNDGDHTRTEHAAHVAAEVLRRANQIADRRTAPGVPEKGHNPLNRTGLTTTQLRVLNAVVALTALRGTMSACVRLSDVSEHAFGGAHRWQREKTRKALKLLAESGLIERRPPAVSDPRAPSYFLALRPAAAGE